MAHALVTVKAVFDLHHLCLSLGGEVALGGRTAQEQGHAGAVVDFDPHRTWHTIPASPAEAAGQLSAVRLYQVFDLRSHGRRVVNVA